MSNKKKLTAICLSVIMVSMMLFNSIQPAKAQFILSGWNDDDGFGQGISAVYVYENSTGVWLKVLDPAFVLPADDTTIMMNYTENTAIQLAPTYTLNHTLQNLPLGGPVGTTPDEEAGRNIMRCGIEVKVLGAVVFSQENLTLVFGGQEIKGGVATSIYWYYAYITIPILIKSGLIYVVELTYEIYPYLYE